MVIIRETVSANTGEASIAQPSAPICPASDLRAVSRAMTEKGVMMANTKDGMESPAEVSNVSP